MASEIAKQLYSRTVWIADGSDTVWNFAFTGGYLHTSHIFAMTRNLLTDEVTNIPINVSTMLIGPFQLQVVPPIAAGLEFTIFRNTPKDLPIVNFEDGGNITETSLDTNAKQAVFIASETVDAVLASVLVQQVSEAQLGEFGLKALKRVIYTGASTVNQADLGKCHYKADSSGVTIPATLQVGFLTSIANNSDATLSIGMATSGVAYIQGGDGSSLTSLTLKARSVATFWQASENVWYASGSFDV